VELGPARDALGPERDEDEHAREQHRVQQGTEKHHRTDHPTDRRQDEADDDFFLAQEGSDDFETDADADTYTGPAPLTVRFSATSINASGRIRHSWAFDDRTTSDEQNPVHTFRRPGWYAVTLDTTDAAGRTYRSNLML